ncbi:MAG: putative acetolactate synthase small subunit [Candidatus Aerophobetes bacterium ADurb.Bin490]|mgnify:CR=1 FL=1|jgi:acetolactate synthase-1/3 small subunit|nr:MAG: putative acetolactate synthase small subunit [Candidatus Aerophobetes bacterium ADurb.Bin490]HNZ30007.1 acetolactate synthase small subunit [Candidatus Goldiibacteriota bacterium]HPI03096.1 acetolactate synthase small subunit [Candidatus Goldiibacteriota bacterium]HPN64216.1 acetolactate synthase small subunit [Candidatus Goldiibacteriota bacterium]HRQ44019.1 acetolactate synthase small subunit [Candidatus Goldiibacteriota bacterium]
MTKTKTISVIVENQPGVLARIAGLFSGRAYNIDSLAVGETEDKSTSRMTIMATGDELVLDQIVKQLNKLIDVIKVVDMSQESYVERELALIKVNVAGKDKTELMNVVNVFRARIVDATNETYMIEVTGTDEKITALTDLVKPFGIQEMSRTGAVALTRGKR